ncbi:MAG: ABC-2 transporter permease [Candidatus Faecousia sp.]|nr:ABC-2 transporter permease [Candidatus Faecousia sp.]
MLGLMRKDLCLLLQRSRALVIMVGVGVIIGFSTDGGFLMGYLTMISAILSIGTISYDEFDNGYPFLLTLPVTRRSYVTAKYLFCLLGVLAGWAAASVIFAGCCLVKGEGFRMAQLTEALAFLPVAGLMTAVMLPLQLKYGAEKSRLALAVLAGVVVALGYVGVKLFPGLPGSLSGVSDAVFGAALVCLCIAALAVSFCCSLGIMNQKEL